MSVLRTPRITRARLRRGSWWTLGIGILLWFISVFLLHITYYGRTISFEFRDGGAALLWGAPEETRSFSMHAGDVWPYSRPTIEPDYSLVPADQRWWVYGPARLIRDFPLRLDNQTPCGVFGLHQPELWQDYISHLGFPFWILCFLGVVGLVTTSEHARHIAPSVLRKLHLDLARIRSCSRWIMIVSGLLWLVSLTLFRATYFGDLFTLRVDAGYIALFWGDESPEGRNTGVLNDFKWPYFPGRGVGTEWSLDTWGRWQIYGPADLLALDVFQSTLRYPINGLGFYYPGCSFTAEPAYLGLPFWPFTLLGISGLIATSRRFHPPRGLCRKCRYDLAGLPPHSPCPECGKAS